MVFVYTESEKDSEREVGASEIRTGRLTLQYLLSVFGEHVEAEVVA